MHALLQDWTDIDGNGSIDVIQSSTSWLSVPHCQDIVFYLDVSYRSLVELEIHYETAPAIDPALFRGMASHFVEVTTSPVVTSVRLSQNPAVPLAGMVRWRLSAPSAPGPWRVVFRLHAWAKGRGWSPRAGA
jgi:hypothetical protein